MIHSRGGKGVRTRGHAFERKIVNEFVEMGIDCCTSRLASKALDDAGVDIFIKDGTPLNIQCKAHNIHKNPIPVIKRMPEDSNYNVVIEKVVHDDEYVYMTKKDFYEIIILLKKEKLWTSQKQKK